MEKAVKTKETTLIPIRDNRLVMSTPSFFRAFAPATSNETRIRLLEEYLHLQELLFASGFYNDERELQEALECRRVIKACLMRLEGLESCLVCPAGLCTNSASNDAANDDDEEEDKDDDDDTLFEGEDLYDDHDDHDHDNDSKEYSDETDNCTTGKTNGDKFEGNRYCQARKIVFPPEFFKKSTKRVTCITNILKTCAANCIYLRWKLEKQPFHKVLQAHGVKANSSPIEHDFTCSGLNGNPCKYWQ